MAAARLLAAASAARSHDRSRLMPDFKGAVAEILSELIDLRHELHAHPELGFEETWTSKRILQALAEVPGLTIRSPVAGTGIMATLNTGRPGRCVALRADMDALPVVEANTFEYRSKHEGRMHACGHDGHIACLVGAARVLARFADEVPGKVRFIFQPAEEGARGARRMIDEGAMDDPPVDAVFAFHGWPANPLGTVQVAAGPLFAAMTSFEVELTGRGTHAAYPHLGADLILTASHIVTQLQAIASRLTDPMDSALVSIGAIHAGETHNTLPETCRMLGTLRAFTQSTHDDAWQRIQAMVESTAERFGAEGKVTSVTHAPPLVNDPQAARLVQSVAREVVGDTNLIPDACPSMGSEDFACFAQRAPSAMWFLGMRPPGCDDYPNVHHPRFDFCDDVMATAVAMHCGVAHGFLTSG
jgi:amidohydrolase